MHTFKLCTATITLVLFNLFSQSSLLAQTVLIDDHTDRTNVNEFDGYWYYYDDYRTVYENDRGYLAPASRQSEINVDYEIYPPRNYDDFSKIPEYKRIYTFTFDEENGNTFATMPFTFGEPWETYTGEANSYVGLATMLAPEGECIDLNEATAISFKIRSRSKKLTFFFKVMTVDITNDSSECYYRYELTTDTQWKEYKINFTDLTQPEDTPESAVREFSISQVTNIVWEVVDINATMVSDTIDLDDIIIYDYFPPHVEPPYIIRFVPPETGQFSAFETTVHELTPLGTNWYAFTDRLNAGSSEINDGAVATDASGYYKLEWVEGSGGDAFGYGPYIVMTFGGSVSIGNSITEVYPWPG